MTNDPLKDLSSVNDEVNAKKKVKEQEYQIKALEKEIASLKSKLEANSGEQLSLPATELCSITVSRYSQAVWGVTVEALLRQTFSVPGAINAGNVSGLSSTILKVLKVADVAVRVAEQHEKDRIEEEKALEKAKSNEALRSLLTDTP